MRRSVGATNECDQCPSAEKRLRSEVKEQAGQYLQEQYTNSDGDIICQVCKAPMPFKLDDGSDYFEKVEFLGAAQSSRSRATVV
jgi:hypothetical protein